MKKNENWFKEEYEGGKPQDDLGSIQAWACYYYLTEKFDATICSGVGRNGPVPATSLERGKSNNYARLVQEAIITVRSRVGETTMDRDYRDTVLRMNPDELKVVANEGGLLQQIEEEIDANRNQGRGSIMLGKISAFYGAQAKQDNGQPVEVDSSWVNLRPAS